MHKGFSILELLDRLSRELPSSAWQVVDHWEADRCAIGVARGDDPRVLVYVSTYGLELGRYSYECEVPVSGESPRSFRAVSQAHSVEWDLLLAVIKQHLGFHPPAPLGDP